MAGFTKSLLIFLVFFCFEARAALRLCAKKEFHPSCTQIASQNTEVRCEEVEDTVDCLNKLKHRQADFGVFAGEEALQTTLNQRELSVVGEIRDKNRPKQNYDFQTVVVVRSDFTGSLENLKGKRYCHPGFTRPQSWTNSVLKTFENKILENSMVCKKDVSFLENHLISLSSFFGPSCRPGPWTSNQWLDNTYRKRYPNLCSLCDDRVACTYSSDSLAARSPHTAALHCLTEKKGDVAYVALSKVHEYFVRDGSGNTTGYKFLCENGMTQDLNTPQPCTWLRQPVNTILANNDQSLEVYSKLASLFPEYGQRRADWTVLLRSILEGKNGLLKLLNTTTPVVDYVAQGRTIPTPLSERKCGSSPIKFCTTSNAELSKCSMMSDAAKTLGLEPSLSCTSARNFRECALNVNSSNADIAVLRTEAGFIARSLMNLAPSAYIEGALSTQYAGIIVISSTSTIKSIKDLKGRRACFPLFGSLGWLNFIELARKNKLLPQNACPGGKHALSFFSETCLPGVKDSKVNPSKVPVPPSACAACSRGKGGPSGANCEASLTNPFFKEEGALRCLTSAAGEVAFLDFIQLKKLLGDGTNGTVRKESLNVLCADGKIVPLTESLDIDSCTTLHVVGNEILSRKSLPKGRRRDIQYALEDLNDWFGVSGRFRHQFQLFGNYNGSSDVIFPNDGSDLVNKYTVNAPFVGDYDTLQDRLKYCSGAATVIINLSLLLVYIVFVFI